jgi:hypothetical protein
LCYNVKHFLNVADKTIYRLTKRLEKGEVGGRRTLDGKK